MSPVGFSQKWPDLLASLLVVPPWVWLAVRTKDFLGFLTGHSVPFSKRAIWLLKLLALVVGAGGLAGALNDLGLPWYLALLPAGIIVWIALTNRVERLDPPVPPQDASAQQLSWNEYWKLRSACALSLKWVGVATISVIIAFVFRNRLRDVIAEIVTIFFFLVLVASFLVSGGRRLKFRRWRCPRCGCAFNGWWNLRFFPKRCVYCGLAIQPKSR